MNRVPSLEGLDRDLRPGRASDGRVLRQTGIWAGVLAALMAVEAAGQEKATSPSENDKYRAAAALDTQPSDKTLDEWLWRMNADTFNVRQDASAAFLEAMWKAFDTGDDADMLLKRLAATESSPSPEQRQRLKSLREALTSWREDLPRALPPLGDIRGGQAARALRTASNIPIHIDEDIATTLDASIVQLPFERGERNVTSVFEKLCRASKTVPRLLPDGSVALVHAGADQRLVATDELLCIVTTHPETQHRTAELMFEPGRGAIVALIDSKGQYSPDHFGGSSPWHMGPPLKEPIETDSTATMTIASAGRPAFRATSVMGKVNENATWQTPDTIGAMVADLPEKTDIAPGKGIAEVGFQRFRMEEPSLSEGGEWIVACKVIVCPDVPWPPTPTYWDRLTYNAANTNRYNVRDADGKDMPATVTDIVFCERTMTVTLACPREPASMTVHAFTRVSERGLTKPKID